MVVHTSTTFKVLHGIARADFWGCAARARTRKRAAEADPSKTCYGACQRPVELQVTDKADMRHDELLRLGMVLALGDGTV